MAALQLIVDPAFELEPWNSAPTQPITLTVNAATRVPTAHPRLDPNKVYEAEFVPDVTPGSPMMTNNGDGTVTISGLQSGTTYGLDIQNQ